MGPTGKLLKPYGDLEFEDAYEAYKEVVLIGKAAGADLVIIETMGDGYELKAAVLAAKENSDLPVFATVTLDEKGKMLTGGNVESVTALLEGLGADVIGLNCGLGPIQLLPFMRDMAKVSSTPILVNPNAGLPRSEGGKTVYDIDADEFATAMQEMARNGATVLGGCCGTTPEHIHKTKLACDDIPVCEITDKNRTVISSYSHAVTFGGRPILIGERINPTGKPKFKQALKDKDLTYILSMGVAQQESRADVLDVNVGLPGIDEPQMMVDVVKELQGVLDLPLQIDTSDPAAMERGMRLYNGCPLVNSVSGKTESMEAVFPLMKKYGGVAIALTLDEQGIPATAEARLAIARRIVETAARYGIPKEDLVFDTLAMAVSAEPTAARTTLEALALIRSELGCHTSLGVSNISFGLPQREKVNAAFFLMALERGLSAAILNPNSAAMMDAFRAFCALNGQDANCQAYIAAMAGETSAPPDRAPAASAAPDLPSAVIRGLRESAVQAAQAALAEKTPMEIIDAALIPALDHVGTEFEQGRMYLPQLLMSAEAAKAVFELLRERMSQGDGGLPASKGKVVLATVKGDVHDIGKNIVKVLLENYGYQVIDLGKDVPKETIVRAARENHASIIGLSALMTTTMQEMRHVIELARAEGLDAKIIIGGAVITQEYADEIHADGYARDAADAVRLARRLLDIREGMGGTYGNE